MGNNSEFLAGHIGKAFQTGSASRFDNKRRIHREARLPGGNRIVGRWKRYSTQSRMTGQMKAGAAGENKFNLIFSGDNVETVVADCTDQPGLFGSTSSTAPTK